MNPVGQTWADWGMLLQSGALLVFGLLDAVIPSLRDERRRVQKLGCGQHL